jgi:hypothetical protein
MELENKGSIEKIELSFLNNNEIVSKNISKEYWETIYLFNNPIYGCVIKN